MKLWVLMENTASNSSFFCEHGLSFYMETAGHKILFDMGQSGNFVKNAKKMGLHLCDVDIAILSHGHYDHGGGLPGIFSRKFQSTRVYSPAGF